MKDKESMLPGNGECKVMEVIVSRNRTTMGREDWQQNILEVFTLDGYQIASEQRSLSCEGPADIIADAIQAIRWPNELDEEKTLLLIEKLQALIKY